MYNGTLYYICPDCNATFNPWNPKRQPKRWAAARDHAERHVACTNTDYTHGDRRAVSIAKWPARRPSTRRPT